MGGREGVVIPLPMMMLARPIIDALNNAVLYVSTIRLFATVNIGIFAGPGPLP